MNENEANNTEPAAAEPATAEQALYRDVSTAMATIDQHSSEIDALNLQALIQMFALGALAGIVFLLARNLREVQGALAG